MITKQVVDDAQSSNLKQYFVDHILQANDGPFYIHVLSNLRAMLHYVAGRSLDPDEPANEFKYFVTIREIIQRRFDESVDVPAHFEKIQWFARYWNDSITDVPSFVDQVIYGPGVAIKPQT